MLMRWLLPKRTVLPSATVILSLGQRTDSCKIIRGHFILQAGKLGSDLFW